LNKKKYPVINSMTKQLYCTGRGGLDPELEAFRAALEVKQKEDVNSSFFLNISLGGTVKAAVYYELTLKNIL
jgi:hypothetical protein